MMGGITACEACLVRAWLIARLAPNIERAAGKAKGERVSGLLRLGNEGLIEAVAPRASELLAPQLNEIRPSTIREAVRNVGASAVCRHDDGFPAGLADLDDSPGALFTMGSLEAIQGLEPRQAVTVVGSRRSTAYGTAAARALGEELAMSGLTVVSGLAMGIDSSVHEGALAAGHSCAVLGTGVDIAYPARNRRLHSAHIKHGTVVSEMPPGSRAWRWSFPARNRIMAAMTGMTVVVESAARSGSLITATVAQELGRDLGAVPGPITSSRSDGPNDLLAEGACVVRNAQDVLDAMVGAGAPRIARAGPELSPDLRVALEAFESGDGDVETVSRALTDRGIEFEESMTKLELSGYLMPAVAGGWNRTALKSPDVE